MSELTVPDVRVRRSFLDAMAEFAAEGRGGAADHTMVGSEIRRFRGSWSTPDGFSAYVQWLRAQALDDAPRPADYLPVPSTTLWWVHGDDYLGRIAIRHHLSAGLLRVGGHIGFDVRPSARNRGHATAMLRAALPVARRLKIDRALVTCDVSNAASRNVIERNGGLLEDQRRDTLRFWVPTTA